MAEKQPLLVVYDKGEALPHFADDANPELQQAARDVRRARCRRVARKIHHRVFTLLIFLGLAYWTRGFGLPALFKSFKSHGPNHNNSADALGSTPLDGPLKLPGGSICRHYSHGKTHAYPTSSYPLVFDSDHSLRVHQNATRHLAPPYDPPRDDDADLRWRHVHVSGEVVVRQVVDGKSPSIDVEALSNDDRIRTAYAYVAEEQSLDVVVDDRVWVEQDHGHGHHGRHGHHHDWAACLEVRVTVWVPGSVGDKEKDKEEAARLKSIRIGAVHLGVQLIDDVDLVVDESARLASIVGSIVASRALPSKDKSAARAAARKEDKLNCHDLAAVAFAPGFRFEARETDVLTTSGPIRGPWALLDRLHIYSVSGNIGVAVSPEGSFDDDAHKELADLRIETVSGNIGFEEVKREKSVSPPSTVDATTPRAHRIALATRSGTLHGSGSFAQSAKIDTTSGNTAVALRPYKLAANGGDDDDEVATLETNTVSGNTQVYLLNEVTGNQTIDFLASTHHAISGTVRLHYPASWVGDIHLKTVAGGALVVEGKGVHVVPDDSPRWPPRIGRTVEAIKEGETSDDDGKTAERTSSLHADTISGTVRLSFPS